ncbi:leucyl/phenylalanyl-tRNA--protein transferase [Spirochaetia bacterium]|nr:leucyl/phenylalanyl-tRNA--protein transferase [Spirochaetia bacterium]
MGVIRYISTGHIFIHPQDDPDEIMDAIIATGYGEEYCVALDFDPAFIARLIGAGFLVMSEQLPVFGTESNDEPIFLLEPCHHLIRSALFFENLHEGKTIQRFLKRYELSVDCDFDFIINRCAEVYGEGWLTKPLRDALRKIREQNDPSARPFSFGVYRDGELRAGEFGTITGRVYTSYSGYHDESNAGKAQMILTARWLRDNGFAFWDLGMPLPYKTEMGAVDLNTKEFLRIFREGKAPYGGGPSLRPVPSTIVIQTDAVTRRSTRMWET